MTSAGRSPTPCNPLRGANEGALKQLLGGGSDANFDEQVNADMMVTGIPELAWKSVGELIQRITMPLPNDMNGSVYYEQTTSPSS